MLEREVKLAASPAFSLPDLEDVAAAVETSPVDERRLETVYYDTPDLRLARWGANLRIRQGEGWTLKLPSTSEGPALTRRELEFAGDGGRPPDAAVALVIAYVRRASLVPVASLSTLRRRVQLKNRDGTLLAEVVDDDVSVIQGLRVQNRFREVEVELKDQSADRLLDPILARLRGAGAADEDPTSKLVRALGARATAVPEVDPLALTPSSTAGEVVRHAIAVSVASLMRHDPGVRLGDDPEDVHRARVATRQRIDEIEGRALTVSRLHDEDTLVFGAHEQTVFEQRGQHSPGARMTSGDHALGENFLVREAGVRQRGNRLLELRVRRLGEHRAGERK